MSPRRPCRAHRLALSALLALLAAAPLSAGHIHRARVYRCIPKYNYGYDTHRQIDQAIAVADAIDVDNTWLEYGLTNIETNIRNHDKYGRPIPSEPVNVRRMPFHLKKKSLVAGPVTLEQVGISVYETGMIRASGRLTHNGGIGGGLHGGNVVIRLRAYGSHPRGVRPVQDFLDPTLLWESDNHVWASHEQPKVVSLVPMHAQPPAAVRRFFDEVTHIEVELVYLRDR